jgi:3-dehydroquinate synthase
MMRLEQTVHVTFRYAIHFTRDIFGPNNRLLLDIMSGRQLRAAVFLDGGLEQARPGLPAEIQDWFAAHRDRFELCALESLPGGETCKTEPEHYQRVVQVLRDSGLDRQSYVIMVGGGAVLDAVAFAASLVRRGPRQIRVPTTVLAQSDSGTGLRTGLNLPAGKDFLGTFAPPWAVVNDFNFLRTLPRRDRIAGVAPAFQVAILKDPAFLSFLTAKAAALREGDDSATEQMIMRSAELHAAQVRQSDPFEAGTARPLDFGHWSAHALETLTGYQLRHGEALAAGIALDLMIARNRGLLGPEQHKAIMRAMTAAGLPLWHLALHCRAEDGTLRIQQGLVEQGRQTGDAPALVMPDGSGDCRPICDVSAEEVECAVKQLEIYWASLADEPEQQSLPPATPAISGYAKV